MGGLSIWHWIVVLVIVILIFGTKKLPNLGSDLGRAIRGFKKGMSDDEQQKLEADPPAKATVEREAAKDRVE